MACPISKNVTFWRDCHETHFLLLLGTQGWCNVKNLIQLREWMVYCAWVFNITYHTPVESKILKKGPFWRGKFLFYPCFTAPDPSVEGLTFLPGYGTLSWYQVVPFQGPVVWKPPSWSSYNKYWCFPQNLEKYTLLLPLLFMRFWHKIFYIVNDRLDQGN